MKGFSSPFGLRMGMSLDEIKNACNKIKPKQIDGDKYYIYPAKNHPLFKEYIAFVDEKEGLYCIKAITDEIKTNKYGNEVKDVFSEIKERVSKSYGSPKMIDKIDSKSIWQDDAYWLNAVSEGARIYEATWKSDLKDDLTCVSIHASANYVWLYGKVILEYDFLNKSSVEDFQDNVF